MSDPRVGWALAGLRRSGAVVAGTLVVAVGVGHDAPPDRELQRRLAGWGVRLVPDATVLPTSPLDLPSHPVRTLVLGGARSGKSAEAERLLAAQPALTYVATSPLTGEGDAEWAARVRAHRRRRPASWSTVETLDLAGVLGAATGPVLVDCLSAWLAGVMDDAGVWAGAPGSDEALAKAVDALEETWRRLTVPVVAVSSEVGSGVVPVAASGRRFRDELGRLNARVAAQSERVLLVVAGRVVELGGPS